MDGIEKFFTKVLWVCFIGYLIFMMIGFVFSATPSIQ